MLDRPEEVQRLRALVETWRDKDADESQLSEMGLRALRQKRACADELEAVLVSRSGEPLQTHARKQALADGFQDGWHAVLSRIRQGDAIHDIRHLVPAPPRVDVRGVVAAIRSSEARIYPDANYERYLDEITGSAVDAVGDSAEDGNDHGSALTRQLTEAVAALRRSRDELRRDMERIGLALVDAGATAGEPPAAGWQPIETAPMDGRTHVLVACGDVVVEAVFALADEDGEGEWMRPDVPGGLIIDPTHWMLLPPLPRAEPAEEEP